MSAIGHIVGGRDEKEEERAQREAAALQRHRKRRQEAERKVRAIVNRSIDQASSRVDLSNLGLAEVPECVAELKYFTSISSAGTVGSITSAIQLYLSFNNLSSLPSFMFVSLANLTVLSLRHNFLTWLPPAIENLVHLQELSLGGNRFSFLPAEILSLPRLTLLNVTNNPFAMDPQAFLESQHALAHQIFLPAHSSPHHSASLTQLPSNRKSASRSRSSSEGTASSATPSGRDPSPSHRVADDWQASVVLRYHRSYSNHQHFHDLRRPRAQKIPSLLELCLRRLATEKQKPAGAKGGPAAVQDLCFPQSVVSFLAVPSRRCFVCQRLVVTWYIRDIQVRDLLSSNIPLEFAFCSPGCFCHFASLPPPDPAPPPVVDEGEGEDFGPVAAAADH